MGHASKRAIADQFIFSASGLDPDRVSRIVGKSLHDADGGELFIQDSRSRSVSISDNEIKSSRGKVRGFGMRYVADDAMSNAYSDSVNEKSIAAAAKAVRGIRQHRAMTGSIAIPDAAPHAPLYTSENPLDDIETEARIKILHDINDYLRAKDSRILQVDASISTGWNVVTIMRHDGQRLDDLRPMAQIAINVLALDQGGTARRGGYQDTGRMTLSDLFARRAWQVGADEAARQLDVNLRAVPAPSGEMDVVLGNGWAGVLAHESVGHGLEADAVRIGASVYKDRIGQRVASPGVTILEEGNRPGERGSLEFDDEGTPTQSNVLIEDGILRGYMHDSISARAMKMALTGNCRRETYASKPQVRMTNTHLASGPYSRDEIIGSVKRGVLAVDFLGGSVNPVNGEYVFDVSEGYLIEDGKTTTPLRGATVIGNGPRSMEMIEMVGNDHMMGRNGMCGKAGQSVPVGVGQPTLKIKGLKIGGSE